MPDKLYSSLAALGIALAPALLQFANAKDAPVDTDATAEVECISQDDAPVHDRYQGAGVQSHLGEGAVVQVVSKRKNWRHIAYVADSQADLGWITTSYLAACSDTPKAPQATDPGAEVETEAPEHPPAGSAHAASGAACFDDLASCPTNGCEEPGSPHALFNEAKRRTTAANGSAVTFESSTPITMEQMQKLQVRAAALVSGKDLTAEERDRIATIKVDGVTFGEGVPVRLAGFLAPHRGSAASGVHPGAVESVNCRLTGDSNHDIHIPLLPTAGDDECSGVITEMIPQGRDQHPAWTTSNLRSIQQDGKQVLFVGPLFYDNEHTVHDDCTATSNQPKRMSLWEVHPVIEFYVCDKPTCQASSKDGWRRVD